MWCIVDVLQQHTACTYKSLSDSLTSLFRVKEFKWNFKAIPKHCAMAVFTLIADMEWICTLGNEQVQSINVSALTPCS